MKNESNNSWFQTWFNTKYYHILYKNRDYTEAENFISNLVNHLNINTTHNCLDLACGKGRHSIFLNKKGLQVTGVDLAEESIKEAKLSENDTLNFFVHDMRNPAWANYFDFVFNLFTSFGYFENERDNYKTIQNISDSLKKEGVLVLDFLNSNKLINNLLSNETKTINGIEFALKREIKDGFIIKNIHFYDGGKEYNYQEKVQALKLTNFEKYFKPANLKIVDIFGDYNLKGFDELNSDRLILIAKKTV